ncbi:voltage-gated potassium channel [Legionella quinlivanii]|uniref:Voltage-gated potassium channel n=1 Tax=Legionella quinlivanii TaxID=45073 RepID=A0A0W0Y4Q0_9GAMM|nr:potassium channel family protein [Legionella quinlivanii]KTD51896.1 voltage-gated potassium channel [Legionella quinlivanii]MCW8452157.1 ion channel [Legionella quinlivanii]SEF84168.1 Ion channel [Legionella quinlivanii DSM 21216]STY09642.1 voltage-gated potassium channel [Legionella quinlivanii]
MKQFISLIERLRFLFLFFVLIAFCLAKTIHAIYADSAEGLANLFFFLLIVSSLFVIGNRSLKLLAILTTTAAIEILLVLIDYPQLNTIRSSFAAIYFMLMFAGCLRYTFRDKSINITTLFGSLCAYLFIGLSYAYIYLMLSSLNPGAFSNLAMNEENLAIYYSFVTLTTIGYGDILPLSPFAQTLSWFESFTGQAYLAIVIGQLVGRYVADRMSSQEH